MGVRTQPAQPAIKSDVDCGYCDGKFHVVPEDGIAYCPACETPHFCTDYYLKPFREAGL